MALNFPEIPVLYEDDDLLVINKPPGFVVNRSQTQKEPTLQDWIEERWDIHASQAHSASTQTSQINTQPHSVESLGKLSDSKGRLQHDVPSLSEDSKVVLGDPLTLFKERSGIVHRLDKDTSGVLLIAKNPEALVACMAQFKLRQTDKTYLALVHGKFQVERGEINEPIARNPKNRLQYTVREGGKDSVTEYKVVEYFSQIDVDKVTASTEKSERLALDFYTKKKQGLPKNFRYAARMYQGFSLVQLHPKTGRTHQLRVHMTHLKHPVVGDIVYSGIKRMLTDQIWCPRIFLHAQSLKIVHPRTKSELIFEAPLPTDLEKTLTYLD